MKKIRINRPAEPLQNPFASLDVGSFDALPEGSEASVDVGPKVSSFKGERLIVRKEKAGRGGKTVMIIHGFKESTSRQTLEEMLRDLRRNLGVGGCMEGSELVLQISDAQRLKLYLTSCGHSVRGP